MNKPIRPAAHILETESSKFFSNQVPDEWFVDKPDHDYGVDFVVNIAVNNQVTGLNFSVQLKSKEKETNPDYASITLKTSTLGFYQMRLEPILLVNYIRQEKEAYWFWYNNLDISYVNNTKTVKVNIPKTNKLGSVDWNAIKKYVQQVFSIKTLVDGIQLLEYDEISNTEILAWKHYYARDYEKASFYFKNLLKDSPKNLVTVLEGLAHALYMSYQYKEALQHINRAIELSGTANQFLTKACILTEDGIANGIRGKLIEAKTIFEKFLQENPEKDVYQFNYANTLRYLEESDTAIKHYKLCLKINPHYAEAWKNLGSVYFNTHNHKEELKCYNRALQINPDLAEALFSKGITLSHIYSKHKEGLTLMLRAIEISDNLVVNFPRGYFWLAYLNEKLNNLQDALYYINQGLSIHPEDIYLLNFKSNLLASNWEKNESFKENAIAFFTYRLELENDYKSLYFLIRIRRIFDEQNLLNLLKKHTPLLKNATLDTFRKCNIAIKSFLTFLLLYDKYLEMRHAHPIHRYIDHLISGHYTISTTLLEVLDLFFATSFSNAIIAYLENRNPKQMEKTILAGLSVAPKAIFELIPNENFSQEDAISIMTSVYLEFPTLVTREFGIQIGFILGNLGLDKRDPTKSITEKWFDDLCELTLLTTNRKLKLLRED